MKSWLHFLFAITLTSVSGQTVDSIVIRQVDSLIQVSRTLTGKGDFEKALDVNSKAENLALEKLGKQSAAFASTCFNRGRVNYFKENFKEAEAGYTESLAIREKVIGKMHPDYAYNLNNLAILYEDLGNLEKAEQFYLECKSIREQVLGILHPDYIQSLNNLAHFYSSIDKYEKAETYLLEVLSSREKALGKNHLHYASSLFALANLYRDMGKYPKAEPYYLETTIIREKILGIEHPMYANSLNSLAILYSLMGNYEKAEMNYLESISIRKKVLGTEDPQYASSLNNLGMLYLEMGNYEKAEPIFIESKRIREKVLGRHHLDYADILSNLADLYSYIGDNKMAEPLYIESIAIKEQIAGKENPEYANSLNNLAILYRDMGNYARAELIYQESKDIRERVLGREHPYYAASLSNLADLYWKMEHYEKVEALYLEAKAIQEKTLGKEHPNYAANLNNLALFYEYKKDFGKAEKFHLEAKDIRGKVLGKEHPNYATSLINLADFYMSMGNYNKAELYLLESKAILEKVLSPEHDYYSQNLNSLAQLYELTHRYSASEVLLVESTTLHQNRLLKACTFLSESELNKYILLFQTRSHQIGSYMLAHQIEGYSDKKSLLPSLNYNNALFNKGFLLNEVGKLNGLAMSTPESKEIYTRLKVSRRLLAIEYSKPLVDSIKVSEMEKKANDAEKELVLSVKDYADGNKQVEWTDVLTKLKPGEAAIEFISFSVNFPKPSDSLMYVALLIKPGDNQPHFIPLFEEKSLDSLLHIKSERKSDYVNGLYTIVSRGAIAVESTKRSLFEIVWQPLEKHLEGIKTIYFSPSGLMHRINLDAIPLSETETLADKYQLIELGSTRQLVFPNQIKNVYNDAVLFGGIQFDQDTAIQNNEPLITSRSRGGMSFRSMDSTLRGGNWNYLAGTEREVNTIEKMMQSVGLKTNLKKGYNATEEAFKNIGSNNAPSPRILHIATHGYFFPDPDRANSAKSGVAHDSATSERTAKAATTRPRVELETEESVFKMSEHPMLRSGLILAGGNAAWQGKQTLEGREDGILTAYEISQMNLSNTELVVLSACETGLGDIQGNEGVYGLQRAFKIAGAKFLIMSLWQVPDKQTSLLMTTFYKKWLEDKMAIPNAFHAAQKELREIGLDPYQWAGFVLVE
ncbi:MAG: CHAT domain-containing protein [Saprospiraceae bacterium]|nr:CHAT domain-containing protein [Saprospiraceae bacterium]